MPSETIAKANAPRPGTSSGRVPKAATYAPRYEPKKSDEKKEARPLTRSGPVASTNARPPSRSGLKTPGPQQQQARPQTAAKDIQRTFTPVEECPCSHADILSLENPDDNAGAAVPAAKQHGFHRAETPARLPTGSKCCICSICTCGVHRCPEPSHFGASYDKITSTYRDSFVGHPGSVPPEKVMPARNKPTWAYDEFENLEKVSTNRGDFKGIWGSHNKKVIHVDELRTGGHKFEETSSHRAAFVEYKDAVPRERIDPRSRDQLTFEVSNEPKTSTMRSDFVGKSSHFCPVRTINVRLDPAGGHMYFRKQSGGRFDYLGTERTINAAATAAAAAPVAAQ